MVSAISRPTIHTSTASQSLPANADTIVAKFPNAVRAGMGPGGAPRATQNIAHIELSKPTPSTKKTEYTASVNPMPAREYRSHILADSDWDPPPVLAALVAFSSGAAVVTAAKDSGSRRSATQKRYLHGRRKAQCGSEPIAVRLRDGNQIPQFIGWS